MKKVIVFGGSGFLGSHVADALSENGYEVRIFDLIKSPFLRPDQEMIIGDICDATAVERAIQGCNYAYNFAGLADLDDAKDRPLEAVRLNILGNIVLMQASQKVGIKRYIFASTIYVYSGAGSFYRASKQASELFVETFFERYGLPYTIVRYGSLYGRRADERNGMYKIVKDALETGVIKYSGSRDAVREYIHVKDAAQLSVRILEDEFANQHIILTGNEKMRVADLINMINEMLSRKLAVEFEDKKNDGHYNLTPYSFNPKIGKKLSANPHLDLGQGIADLMAEFYERTHIKEKGVGDWIVLDETNGS